MKDYKLVKSNEWSKDWRKYNVVVDGGTIAGTVAYAWIRPGGWCWVTNQRGFKTLEKAAIATVASYRRAQKLSTVFQSCDTCEYQTKRTSESYDRTWFMCQRLDIPCDMVNFTCGAWVERDKKEE